MEITNKLSAFAAYRTTNNQNDRNKAVRKMNSKLKQKLKLKFRKDKNTNEKRINSRKADLGAHEDKAEKKRNKTQLIKLRNKSKIKLKSQCSEKNEKTLLLSKKKNPDISNGVEGSPSVKSTSNNSFLTLNSSEHPNTSPQNPIMKGCQLFEWMIAPITSKTFFDRYWETQCLYVARSNKKYFTHLLTSKCLDQMFRNNNLYYTRNVDVVIYENKEKQVMNPEGRASNSALWDFYSNGCSIRILNPQTYNKKVHLLVSTLQEYFGSMVGVNAYLTPPNSQGFAPHYDDIEAFVIQLEGRKHWRLYHPKEEEFLARYSSKNFTHEEIGDPFLEVTVEQGSLLYFPRGIIHEGKTDMDSHSLHLTVSLYQNNAYVDLLESALPKALIQASKSDIEFRRGLPLHFLKNGNSKQLIKEKMLSLIDKLKDYLDVDKGISELGRRLVYNSMPPMLSSEEIACSSKQDGDLLDNGVVYNRVVLDISTKIRLTRYHCIQLVLDEENVPRLYYSTENANVYHGENEQFLELDMCMIPAIETLQKSYPTFVEIGLLPLESVELKVQFVYDLWEKGIVITNEPLSSFSTGDESFDESSNYCSE